MKDRVIYQYVVLLRGINVGGNNKISMQVLTQKLNDYGYLNVKTYINSGNILLESLIEEKNKVKIDIEKLILNEFKLNIIVHVITFNELFEMKQKCPKWWGLNENSRYNALFVIPPMTSEKVMTQMGNLNPEIERCEYFDQILFWEVKNDFYSKSQYSKILGKSCYSSLTVRNANTFNKLVELCKK